MKRGDFVIAAERGRLTGKPRPWLVVQADAFNEHHASVTLALVSTGVAEFPYFRVGVAPTSGNGLVEPSVVHIDKLATVSRDNIVQVIGSATESELAEVDVALRGWFDL